MKALGIINTFNCNNHKDMVKIEHCGVVISNPPLHSGGLDF
jgi:hypothetical protein